MSFASATRAANRFSKEFKRYFTAVPIGDGYWEVSDRFHPLARGKA